MQRYTNRTPFTEMRNEEGGLLLSVASFNLLAPCYVRPFDKRTGTIQSFAAFEWVEDSHLEWKTRRERLLRDLQSCRADVICVQELQMERGAGNKKELVMPGWIQPLLKDYKVQLPPQEELEVIAERNVRVLGVDAAVTCAILYRSWVAATATNEDACVDTNTSVSVCLSPGNGDLDTFVVVSCVHLDASDEKKRVGQLTRCLRRARALMSAQHESFRPMSTIIAGDMNQEFLTGSCLTAVLSDEAVCQADLEKECASALRLEKGTAPSKSQMKDWKELHNQAQQVPKDYCVSLSRVETGATRAAYEHGEDKKMAQWHLDHMVHTSNIWPVSLWSTLEDDSESSASGLPNASCPTDHLPIGAVFAVSPAPQLNESDKKLLIGRLNSLTTNQKTQLNELQSQLDAEIAAAEAKHPKAGDDTSGGETKKKKRGKKPPPEIMELMRRKRSMVKEMKAAHSKERENAVAGLNDCERLAVQAEYGYSACIWVERG